MSTEVYSNWVYITRLCGPASMGEDRALWQFGLSSGQEDVQLERGDVIELVTALAESVGLVVFPRRDDDPKIYVSPGTRHHG